MSNKLLERLKKNNKIKVMSDSLVYKRKESIPTELPILNVAFSGELDGGLVPGFTIIAGPSKSYKSLLSLYCLKAFQEKYPDGVAVFYDCEYGISEDYMRMVGVDPERVIYEEVEDVEDLKIKMVKFIKNDVEKGDNVFILIDSLGNIASRKELDDIENEKVVSDMTRAKSLKSFGRSATNLLVQKGIYCVGINHVYMEIGLYPKAIVSGGTGLMYSANQVFIMGKSQIKEGTEIVGYDFTINIEKSRFVREKSKLPFSVLNNEGIKKWSSMFELALEAGFIDKAKMGWYVTVDPETGEVSETNKRKGDIEKDNGFFEKLVVNEKFKEFVRGKYKLSASELEKNNSDDDEDVQDILGDD